MAKNRKHQSAAIRFGPALKAFLLCVLIGGSGVGYVWQKSQIDELGRQITQREKRLRELDGQNKKLRGQLAELCSPGQLNDKVQKLNLGLCRPLPNQVWTLTEPVMAPAASANVAGQPDRSQLDPGLAMH